MTNKYHIQFIKLAICIFTLVLIPLQVNAKTFKTDHFKFAAGFMWTYSEEEKQTINQCVDRLEDIWQEANKISGGKLPKSIRIEVTTQGTMSRAVRGEDKILINSLKIQNGLRDCVTILAHEATHLGLYNLSNRRITDNKNKFLDEGIASVTSNSFEPDIDNKRQFSINVAKADLETGAASLEYLRDWKGNVGDRLWKFSKEWKRKHPRKYTTIEDELSYGVNSYFTSTEFAEYVINVYGLPKLINAITHIGNSDSQSSAFRKATGKSIEELFIEWHAFLRRDKSVPIKWDPQKVQTY